MNKPMEPFPCFPEQYRKYETEYTFDADQQLDPTIIEHLYQASIAGKEIHISINMNRGYGKYDDQPYAELSISSPDTEAYEKALLTYQYNMNLYKTNMKLYNEYLKSEEDKKEREAKAKRYAQFLELKNEFEGKSK